MQPVVNAGLARTNRELSPPPKPNAIVRRGIGVSPRAYQRASVTALNIKPRNKLIYKTTQSAWLPAPLFTLCRLCYCGVVCLCVRVCVRLCRWDICCWMFRGKTRRVIPVPGDQEFNCTTFERPILARERTKTLHLGRENTIQQTKNSIKCTINYKYKLFHARKLIAFAAR